MTQTGQNIQEQIKEVDKQLEKLEQLENEVKALKAQKRSSHFYDSQGFWVLVASISLLIIACYNNVQ